MAYIIQEKQDLTHLSWSKIRNSSGTAGSFLKAYDDTGEIKEYYKLSNFDSVAGVVGHESVKPGYVFQRISRRPVKVRWHWRISMK